MKFYLKSSQTGKLFKAIQRDILISYHYKMIKFLCCIVKKRYNKVHGQEMLWTTLQELIMLEIHFVIFQVSFVGSINFP